MTETATLTTEQTKPKKRSRLPILIGVGIFAIIGGIVLRNSPWQRERELSRMSVQELAYAIHDRPKDALTFIYYASELMKMGNLPDSEKAFEQAIKNEPNSARAYLGLASVQMRQGKLKPAHDSFLKATQLDPKNTPALVGLSQTLYQAGSARQAIEPLKKVVEIEPKNAVGWYHLGRLYGDDRQSDLAYDAMKKATEIDPSRADYWRDLSQLSKRYGKMEDAEKQLLRALKLEPNDAIAHYWLGQLYAQLEDNRDNYGRAEQEFLAAIARSPEMQEAYFELGMLYGRHQNYTPAVANLRKAVALDSSDDKALYQLGTTLMKQGNKAEGDKLLKGAKALNIAKKEINDARNRTLAEPKNRELRLRLARIYRKYQNPDEALREYRAYRSLGTPDPAVEKEVITYLASLKQTQPNAPK